MSRLRDLLWPQKIGAAASPSMTNPQSLAEARRALSAARENAIRLREESASARKTVTSSLRVLDQYKADIDFQQTRADRAEAALLAVEVERNEFEARHAALRADVQQLVDRPDGYREWSTQGRSGTVSVVDLVRLRLVLDRDGDRG